MLRTNLSTRPFYNERLVYAVLGACALLVLAASVYNVTRLISLSREVATGQVTSAQDEAAARELRRTAATLRGTLQPEDVAAIGAATQEANTLIDRRTFSWTELFNFLERTLPANVMLTSVRPSIEQGQVRIALAVVGRSIDDLDTFMRELERTGVFANVLSVSEQAQDDGTFEARVVADYRAPSAATPSEANAPAADQPDAAAADHDVPVDVAGRTGGEER